MCPVGLFYKFAMLRCRDQLRLGDTMRCTQGIESDVAQCARLGFAQYVYIRSQDLSVSAPAEAPLSLQGSPDSFFEREDGLMRWLVVPPFAGIAT